MKLQHFSSGGSPPVENAARSLDVRVMPQYADFRERAEQCMQFEKQARTLHDREFFHKMAMAWLGRTDGSRPVPRLDRTADKHFRLSHYRAKSTQRQRLQ